MLESGAAFGSDDRAHAPEQSNDNDSVGELPGHASANGPPPESPTAASDRGRGGRPPPPRRPPSRGCTGTGDRWSPRPRGGRRRPGGARVVLPHGGHSAGSAGARPGCRDARAPVAPMRRRIRRSPARDSPRGRRPRDAAARSVARRASAGEAIELTRVSQARSRQCHSRVGHAELREKTGAIAPVSTQHSCIAGVSKVHGDATVLL